MNIKKIIFIFFIAIGLSGCSGDKGKILDFPVARQAYEYSCGPGCVQHIMTYYGEDFHESELIDLLKTDKDEGTYVKDIVRFFHFNGLKTEVKEKMTIGELQNYVRREIPVITLIQAWGSEKDFNNRYRDCWSSGHFVVVIGYTDKYLLISDPVLFNVGYIPFSEFMDRWHDTDEGVTKTYQLGIAVWGKKPVFDKEKLERIK